MLFENEKNNIEENSDFSLQEENTVTWEDVLSSDDDLVIIDKPEIKSIKDRPSDISSSVNLGDELELIQSPEEEINDDELMEILKSADKPASSVPSVEEIVPSEPEEEEDIESQLADVILDDSKNIAKPRKPAQKNKSSMLPLLLSILVAVLVGGGVYYYTQYFSDSENLAQEEIAPPNTPQNEMNNINQEMLEQRKQENNIPVVNEEQASEVQPDKKEDEKKDTDQKSEEEEKEAEKKNDKKEVIVVTPTGRSNPFLPIAKYVTSTIPETNVDFDRAGIPKPPESYGEKETETSKMMTIAVSGIMYDEVKPSAIITYDNNDYFVQKGDKLDDYKVLDITRTYVTLALNNNVYKANIGEEFKVSNQIYGKAQFIPQQQGGGRQYYSVGTQDRMMGVERQLRYVSESDITINAR